MKKIISNSPAGIFSIIKEAGQRKYRLYFQGSENSAEILIGTVANEGEANEKIATMLKTK